MQLGDLASLLQLSVGANFGFGALMSFYEPLSGRTSASIEVIEKNMIRIINEHNADVPRVPKIFRISKMYNELQQRLGILRWEQALWERWPARMIFAISGLVSFILLIVVSATASNDSPPVFFVIACLAVAFNLPPLIFGLCMFFVSAKHEASINPLLESIQNLIYEDFLRPELLETDRH